MTERSLQEQVLVIGNGEPPSRALTRRLARESGYVVAADGGANVARRYGIRPDVIIGDLDSITQSTRRHFVAATVLHVARQDNTDLEKALDFVLAQGIRQVTITGVDGRRTDFTLANLSILWRYAIRAHLTVAAEGWNAYPVTGKFHGRARRGTTVSIIPFGRCSGVTLRGLRYPLRNATLRVGEIGVSNVVVRSRFSVSVKKGHLLVFVLDGDGGRSRGT